MTTVPARGKLLWFALAVTMLTGFVDATGFLAFGRLFPASPDAGSVVARVGLIENLRTGLFAGGLVLAFLVGVIVTSLAAARFPGHRRSTPLLGAGRLLLVAFLLETVVVHAAAVVAAMAMGAVHGIFGKDDRSLSEALLPSVQLVRFGEALARPKIDGGRSMLRHAALWIVFLVGGTLGAASSALAPGRSFALAAVLALLLVFPALLLDRQAAGKPDVD
jgi:uncharacterized membrane protein YoaK (UPF0700 family)